MCLRCTPARLLMPLRQAERDALRPIAPRSPRVQRQLDQRLDAARVLRDQGELEGWEMAAVEPDDWAQRQSCYFGDPYEPQSSSGRAA